MSRANVTHAYVLFAPCGCPVEMAADTGVGRTWKLRPGGRIELLPLDEARALAPKMYGCTACSEGAGAKTAEGSR